MKKIWNKVHDSYAAQEWIDKPSIFAETAISYFPTKGSIIELGGALGQDSAFFKDKGYDVLLSDISEKVLAIAKEKHNLSTRVIDVSKPLLFGDKSFDVVYAHLSLHYFDKKTTYSVFKEIHRILKPGGIFAALFNSTTDPEYNTGEKIEDNLFLIRSMKKRFFNIESVKLFASNFEQLLLDNRGETYKDNAKGVVNLIRFVGRKI